MKRVLTCVCVMFCALLLLQFLSVFFSRTIGLATLGPMVVIFTLQYFRPLEAIISGALIGGVIDLLSGTFLGLNMLVILLLVLLLGASSLFHARPERLRHMLYVGGCSLLYRIFLAFIQMVFYGRAYNLEWASFLFGPFFDAFLSVIIFRIVIEGLTFMGAFERYDFYGHRMSSYSV